MKKFILLIKIISIIILSNVASSLQAQVLRDGKYTIAINGKFLQPKNYNAIFGPDPFKWKIKKLQNDPNNVFTISYSFNGKTYYLTTPLCNEGNIIKLVDTLTSNSQQQLWQLNVNSLTTNIASVESGFFITPMAISNPKQTQAFTLPGYNCTGYCTGINHNAGNNFICQFMTFHRTN